MYSYKNTKELIYNKKLAFERANYKCEKCGEPAKEIHHIDNSKVDHSLNNLQSLCIKCHHKITQINNQNNNKLNINKIEHMLKIKNMTKVMLAKEIGLSINTIYHLFSAGSTYRRTVKKIAKVLGCTIEEILL